NASFNFSSSYEAPAHTINQPWTSVVLEGLRRMDEGVKPRNPFSQKVESVALQPLEQKSEPEVLTAVEQPAPAHVTAKNTVAMLDETATIEVPAAAHQVKDQVTAELSKTPKADTKTIAVIANHDVKDSLPEASQRPVIKPVNDAFLASVQKSSRFASAPLKVAAIFAALILVVAAIAVPWYAKGRAAKAANQTSQTPTESSPTASQPASGTDEAASANSTQSPEEANSSSASTDAADAARREREARAREEARLKAKSSEAASTTPANSIASATPQPPANASRKVTVQVTYDENGRVTQATGNDPTALRIARQKRFPPGKAGSTTITIPIN
ncbi:MAG TPA: hypothetical protein VE863_20255, partial [Pyrinomonadaceae bacterium]|nr:hypothetical protein [Pyrinomonadaceae bacterium]